MAKKILIVDDEPDTLKTFIDLFQSEGYDVTAVDTGEKALDTINGYQPDVILLDIMLPGRNGIEVARELGSRGTARRIPIVMITALSAFPVGDLSLAEETGIRRFIFKPCQSRTLLQVVDDAVRYG